MIDATGKKYPEADHFQSSDPNYPIDRFFSICDVEKFRDFKYFVEQVNLRAEWQRGLTESYNYKEYALNPDTEYFHPMITYDDRMVYIMQNIVGLPDSQLSPRNKIGNTIISHFYGARGIHQIATRENDVKKAHVDFENYFTSGERDRIRRNLELAPIAKLPIYGSTELRTSLFGAANKYQVQRFGQNADRVHPGNIMDWVAGLCEDGMFDDMMASKSSAETFKILTRNEGIGSYYGFHCSTSNSVNPALAWDNDENFVKPGPGAQYTLRLLFPKATSKEITNGDLVIWFRHNQKFFGFGDVVIHESAHNVLDHNGNKILSKDQVEMMTYGSEVGMCQYGIFCKIRDDKKAIERRKVSRLANVDVVEELNKAEKTKFISDNPSSLEAFFGEDDPAVCQVPNG
jgi:hypothetical protein